MLKTFLFILIALIIHFDALAQVVPRNPSDTSANLRSINIPIESRNACEEGKHELLWDLSILDSTDWPKSLALYGMRYDEGDMSTINYRTIQLDSSSIASNKPIIITSPGYYWFDAVDSVNHIRYSSERIQIELCALFKLDDFFRAGPGRYYKPTYSQNIEQIDLIIFNSQGEEVFTTKNPNFKWDGNNAFTGAPCLPGSYFYHCDIIENKGAGKLKRNITGIIDLSY